MSRLASNPKEETPLSFDEKLMAVFGVLLVALMGLITWTNL